ncbi:MAG: Gfo/Idh/MocA family oxidoreductase, partial [Planctomycetes bacterium]|nr:Gfo/Idh/MocA family oxidoreductase [Planctomycetota bacterium]
MGGKPLRLALVGAGDLGQKCMKALADVEGFTLVGVADRDTSATEQAAAEARAEAFTDHRQMLTQLKPDVVLLTASPASAVEMVRLAAGQGIRVIKASPLGRTLDEAAEMVNAMASAGREFAVLTPRRFFASYRGLLTSRAQLGRLFLGRAQYVLNWG